MTAWNLKQLKDAMNQDLLMCHTTLEKTMCRVVCGKEIRERAYEIAAVRKLTPGEVAIASKFGYRA